MIDIARVAYQLIPLVLYPLRMSDDNPLYAALTHMSEALAPPADAHGRTPASSLPASNLPAGTRWPTWFVPYEQQPDLTICVEHHLLVSDQGYVFFSRDVSLSQDKAPPPSKDAVNVAEAWNHSLRGYRMRATGSLSFATFRLQSSLDRKPSSFAVAWDEWDKTRNGDEPLTTDAAEKAILEKFKSVQTWQRSTHEQVVPKRPIPQPRTSSLKRALSEEEEGDEHKESDYAATAATANLSSGASPSPAKRARATAPT